MNTIPSTPDLNDPKFAGAVDLDDVKERAAREQAEREARAYQAALAHIRAKERVMSRAFKGIFPAPYRIKSLIRSAERAERERGDV